MMMIDEEITIETSPLSRMVKHDGIEVEMLIYRMEGSEEGWSLEIVDGEGASTVWDELFESDQAAFDEAMRTIEEEGISVFLRPPDDQLH